MDKRKNRNRRIVTLLLVSGILCTMPGMVYAADSTPKEENIYGKLLADGSVDKLYAVNEYTLSKAQTITDYGDYSSVKNITTDDEIVRQGDKLTLSGARGKYYYQGELVTKELPWNISVKYYLDEKEIKAEELGGKSGKLEIVLATKKNTKVTEAFFENYLLQGKVVLDTKLCDNIRAQGATIASVGSDKQLMFNIMPDKEKEYHIYADVTSFEMDGITFSAVPVSFDIDRSTIDTDEIDSQITDLQDAVNKLDDGAGDLKDGAKELREGAYDLHDGSIDLFEGSTDLNDGAKELYDGAVKLNEGAQNLCDGSGSLEKGTNSMRDGLNELNGKSEELKNGSSRLLAGTNSLVEGVEGANISEEEIALMITPAIKQGVAGALKAAGISSNEVIEAVAAQTASEVSAGIGAGMSSAVKEKMAPLQQGAASLQTGAKDLNTGVEAYTGAVGSLKTGSEQVSDGVSKLRNGIYNLKDGTNELVDGTADLLDGTGELVDGTSDLYDGTKDLYEGTGDLYDGTRDLTDGTDEFKTETSDMDTKMNDKIDEALSKVSGDDYSPVSFVSNKNKNVTAVQFALTTEAITIPEEEITETVPETLTFWQKFIQLFK